MLLVSPILTSVIIFSINLIVAHDFSYSILLLNNGSFVNREYCDFDSNNMDKVNFNERNKYVV